MSVTPILYSFEPRVHKRAELAIATSENHQWRIEAANALNGAKLRLSAAETKCQLRKVIAYKVLIDGLTGLLKISCDYTFCCASILLLNINTTIATTSTPTSTATATPLPTSLVASADANDGEDECLYVYYPSDGYPPYGYII